MASRDRMRADWDARAQLDAMHYIAFRPGGPPQDRGEFYRSGERDAARLARPILDRLQFDPHGARILEIGCGMGRLFPGFRMLGFTEIWGTDVSPEMVRLGSEHCPVREAHFLALDDRGLDALEGGWFDYVFSYAVFQHIPDREVIWSYLRGVRRLLRTGGGFQLQFMTPPDPLYRVMQRLPELVHKPVSYLFQQIEAVRRSGSLERRIIPGSVDTWAGARLDAAEVRQRLVDLGFSRVEIVPDLAHAGGHSWWAIGRS